jgi:hypothetical protein
LFEPSRSIWFEFFNKQDASLYISTNGFISFDSSASNNYGIEYIYPNNIFSAIAPFWSDIDTTRCGNIYYRETTNLTTLSLISKDIQNGFDLNFLAKWAFIVTYDRVCRFHSFDGLTNSFQIVITTDGSSSYIIYNYGQLTWYENCLSYALYNAGDGIAYSILPGSLSSDILKLSYLSNNRIPGQWIFDVSYNSFAPTTVTKLSSEK